MGVNRGHAYLYSLNENSELNPNSLSPQEMKNLLSKNVKGGEAYAIGEDDGSISVDMIFFPKGILIVDENFMKNGHIENKKIYEMEEIVVDENKERKNRIDLVLSKSYYGSASRNAIERVLRNRPENDLLALYKSVGKTGLYTEFIRIEPYSISSAYRRKIENGRQKNWMKRISGFEPLEPVNQV